MAWSHHYCSIFATTVRQQWKELQSFTSAQRFARNEVVYSIGDPPDAMYLIESGLVRVAQLSAKGEEKITAIYQKGDLFGEVCLCEKAERGSQAIALEPLSVISFQTKQLLSLLRAHPELTLNLLMVFCARLVECGEQIASLAFDAVPKRLAKEIFRLSRLSPGRSAEGGVQLPRSLTHQQLADLVNTTRENVTRILNQFRREGLLDYRRGRFLVFPNKLGEQFKS